MNARQQTDLDFSKAFDTVPHRRSIKKLGFYGVRGPLLHWISSWLSKRQQRVTVDGETSGATLVKSGVPQGTVQRTSRVPCLYQGHQQRRYILSMTLC